MRLSYLRQQCLELWLSTKGGVGLLIDPQNLGFAMNVEDGFIHHKANKLAVEYIKSDPGVAQIFAEQYLAPLPDMDALLKLPTNSLGYAYADRTILSGFNPHFYASRPLNFSYQKDTRDDPTYMLVRMRQSHDIWHVMTGFGMDVYGEIGLKAFEIAQVGNTAAFIIVLGALVLNIFKSPENLQDLLTHIIIGYQMGRKAKPFLAQKWEENWDKPLAEWRTELNITPYSRSKEKSLNKVELAPQNQHLINA
ncbi:hypothetical protein BZZ01_04155 [Nostocales cyanobacterium HT-58-2]|nr:hypothetical protein BZZ01_04155 [Nostocales cyanobacterium HT-58-2]